MLKHKSSIIITALIAFVIALALIVATMYSSLANVQRLQLRTETEMASLWLFICGVMPRSDLKEYKNI